MTPPPTLRYADGVLTLLDQTKLPTETTEFVCRDVPVVYDAIRRLVVRGAPAIGCAAAYGVCVAARRAVADGEPVRGAIAAACDHLATSRPTAVNLFFALDRVRGAADAVPANASDEELVAVVERTASRLEADDRAMCAAIGRHGAELLPEGGVLTHCNAGALATAGDGTALSVLFAAHADGKAIHVYADETRPLLQGARLTTWECMQRGVPVTLLCDNMAGWAMRTGRIRAVVTGADRVAGNGDAANKIGTYSVAVLARHHDIPFYIAAPSSTFDLELESGEAIPIEERAAEEVTCGFGRQTAPEGCDVWSPAFDVTPAELITALITERGVIRAPDTARVQSHLLTPPDSAG